VPIDEIEDVVAQRLDPLGNAKIHVFPRVVLLRPSQRRWAALLL
jgi:hypothetical protein